MELPLEPWFSGIEERRRRKKEAKRGMREGARRFDALLAPSLEAEEAAPESEEQGAGRDRSDESEGVARNAAGRRKAKASTTPGTFKPGHPYHRSKLTPVVRNRRRLLIGQLLANGLSHADIVEACFHPPESLGDLHFRTRTQIEKAIALVKEEWAQHDAEQAPRLKAMAVRRILDHIQKAKAKSAYAAIATLERTLADIQGTREPLRIEVDVTAAQRAALAGAIAAMSPERVVALAERMRELRSEHQRRLLGEALPTIDVIVEESLAEVSK